MEKIDIKSLNYDELADYIHGCMKSLPVVMMR